eukprot:TRINITY_DN11462_c0_g2_i1.p2 TRINITY_DN11462_c0_g2~~TRINITY_DN11462_c0_g2_i1.p2  ORF type:complete len:229 (-),score=-18.93 TRINITY_DN11462_c0_g2_i1:1463-2149(-)
MDTKGLHPAHQLSTVGNNTGMVRRHRFFLHRPQKTQQAIITVQYQTNLPHRRPSLRIKPSTKKTQLNNSFHLGGLRGVLKPRIQRLQDTALLFQPLNSLHEKRFRHAEIHRRAAGNHLQRHHAEGVDVRGRRGAPGCDVFRRHITEYSADVAGGVVFLVAARDELSEGETAEARIEIHVKKNVPGSYALVNDALLPFLMQIRQRRGQSDEHPVPARPVEEETRRIEEF